MATPKQIRLTHGHVALVDPEDFDRFGGLKWTAQIQKSGKIYAYRNEPQANGKLKNVYLHRLILGVADGVLVDHEDGDGLHCQRLNLRPATYSQNACNSKRTPNIHGFIGVDSQTAGRYRGRVFINHHSHYTPTFPTPTLAAAARDALARELHKEFAVLNFPTTH